MERRLQDAYQRRAKCETNNHGNTQGESHLHDGPAQVFQMLEKRFGSFALRQIAKLENVAQRHRTENSARHQRQKTASSESSANAECVSVANFVLCDHAPNLFDSKFAAIENRFAFIVLRSLFAWLNRTRQE